MFSVQSRVDLIQCLCDINQFTHKYLYILTVSLHLSGHSFCCFIGLHEKVLFIYSIHLYSLTVYRSSVCVCVLFLTRELLNCIPLFLYQTMTIKTSKEYTKGHKNVSIHKLIFFTLR